jgi:hypothetical protein
MKLKAVALVFGSASILIAGGISAVACGGDDNTNPPISGDDSSIPDTYTPPVDTGTPDNYIPPNDSGQGDSPNDSGGDSGDGGADAHCVTAPTLRPGTGVSLFCPFIGDAGDVADASGCTPKTDECCVGGSLGGDAGFAPSTCNPIGTGCADSGTFPVEIDCEDPATDCPLLGDGGTQVCCANATTTSVPKFNAACGYYQLPKWNYNKCAAACANANEVQICQAQSECPANTLCTPFRTTDGNVNLGWCCATNDAGVCPQ